MSRKSSARLRENSVLASEESKEYLQSKGGVSIQPHGSCQFDLVSLGEVMLRFDPGNDRISRASSFRVWEGGGEYNVARGLRRCFGLRSAIVTALVDNPVGRLVENLILQGGVDTTHIQWKPFDGVGRESRNGIYFLERGFGVRGGIGMMDRGHTAISQLGPGDIDWDALFADQGVRWFHTGGIMAALGPGSVELVLEAMSAAKRHGVVVSFDCNYRPSLWAARGGRQAAAAVNREFMPYIDVLFGHEGDLAATPSEVSKAAVWHTLETFDTMARRIQAEFPSVKVIASTVRRAHTANRNDWGAFGYSEGKSVEALCFNSLEIFDRVGGGDSFASGVIYGLLQDKSLKWSLDCGVAHGALTMTTPGDASMATLAEVERLMEGGSAHTIR
jgi:2-dehydro-3-deoxygluconokinase